MTDEELVREVQERLALRQSAEARQSLGCLVERQYDWLMRMCLFETSSRELAEECVQQIMLELTKSIGSFSFRSSLKTWLFAIARRTVKRHRKRHYRLLSFFEREQEEFREECARGVDAVFPDGETRRLVSERGRRVLD
ncbi:MAG TPA: sigma factor, partial [Oligoflexia bacterium]|nr:sigma factor [Oligoflexia bacterium]